MSAGTRRNVGVVVGDRGGRSASISGNDGVDGGGRVVLTVVTAVRR